MGTENPVQFPISERHVQAIWFDESLRPRNLRTAEGTTLDVIDPGKWNLSAGPDFRDALISVGGSRMRGDVEIHLRPGDWTAHGHDKDPAYSHVIAHVTWHGGSESALPPGCVCIRIGGFLRTQPDFSPMEIDLAAYPYAHLPSTPRPCERRFAGHVDLALGIMCAAGRQRLEEKSAHIKALIVRRGDSLQVLYEETLAALGYSRNKSAFRRLARILPLCDLPADPDAAATVLSCAAGLSAGADGPWDMQNSRPANNPERRIVSAAKLFAGGSRVGRIMRADMSRTSGINEVMAILREECSIGPGRSAALLANVIIPFAHASGNLSSMPDHLPPEDMNATVRLMAWRLLGRDHNPALYSGNGILIQGLIALYRRFCLAAEPDCAGCQLASTCASPA